MSSFESDRLLAGLKADRQMLLDSLEDIGERDLQLPTRNPGWTVRQVLAHVLAADKDLIAFLDAAIRDPTDASVPGHREHERETARWMDKPARAIWAELRARGERWHRLIGALPEETFAGEVRSISEWQGHDAQHAEDVRLALLSE